MFGRLRGTYAGREGEAVLVDVGGVGYEVHCSRRVVADLPEEGAPLLVWVETVVREDMIRLHGFRDRAERAWFRILTSVQGVGAKVAAAILSVLEASDMKAAVLSGDHKPFALASGVGPKLAQRIVAELKGKELPDTGDTVGTPSSQAGADARAALVGLGYPAARAATAVATAEAALGPGATVEAILGAALKLA